MTTKRIFLLDKSRDYKRYVKIPCGGLIRELPCLSTKNYSASCKKAQRRIAFVNRQLRAAEMSVQNDLGRMSRKK